MIEMKTWDEAIILETELDLFKFKQFESEIIYLANHKMVFKIQPQLS